MTVPTIREAAEAGANRTLGNQYTEHDILDLVNEICNTRFTYEQAESRPIIVAYTSAEIFWHQSLQTPSMQDDTDDLREAEAAKYGCEQAEKHPFYRELQLFHADYDDPRRTQH